jgi:CheY-like chemotaxis protein
MAPLKRVAGTSALAVGGLVVDKMERQCSFQWVNGFDQHMPEHAGRFVATLDINAAKSLPAEGMGTMVRILIVDDDEGFRSILSEYLGGHGYECYTAADVEQARGHLEELHYDLVLSDFHIPGESGLDLLRYVSCLHPSTRFILISGTGERRIWTEARTMGAWECFDKPLRLAELLDSMSRALQPEVNHFPKPLVRSPAAACYF